MFKVGDVIEPNEGAQKNYGVTRRPTMTKGVVTEVFEGRTHADIQVKITEGDEFDEYGDRNIEVGNSYPVSSKHFNLAIPLNADEAFKRLLSGEWNDGEYNSYMETLNKNT